MKWVVPQDWKDETVFLIGGGPSVANVDLTCLRQQRVVVVNSSYLVYPDADTLLFTDIRWWGKYKPKFKGEIVTITPVHKLYPKNILVLDRQRSGGLSHDPTRLACWHTSMTTAINLIALRGAKRIAILGLDGQGEWHHAPYPLVWGRNKDKFRFHREALEDLRPQLEEWGVEVYNLNPNSTHKMFPFASLDKMLDRWSAKELAEADAEAKELFKFFHPDGVA